MNKNEELCERLEITVLSGEEMSDELNNHVKSCERCGKFLEQNRMLELDLKNLNASGIEEGIITEAVMAKVRAQKKKTPVKFSFTHHLGTAAALVIICAAALYVKNVPSDVGDKTVEYTEDSVEKNSQIIRNAYIIPADETDDGAQESSEYGILRSSLDEAAIEVEAADEEMLPESGIVTYDSGSGDSSHNDYEADIDNGVTIKVDYFYTQEYAAEEESIQGKNEEAKPEGAQTSDALLKSTASESNRDADTDDAVYEEAAAEQAAPREPEATESAPADESSQKLFMENTETESEIPQSAYTDSSDADAPSESHTEAETESARPSSGGGSSGSAAGMGGGGGGSSSARYEKEVADSDKYSDDFLVFEDVEFLQGEENLYTNINIANARLAQLYGEEFCVIDGFCLANNGWGGNAFFFDTAPTMTYSFIKSLEGSSRSITGK